MKKLFLILIICLVPIPNSFACTCALPIDLTTAIDYAEYSFLGVVTNIEKEDGWQTITFDIKDPIKGNLNQTHTLQEEIVGGVSCGVDYEMNRLYFVNQYKIVQNNETSLWLENESEPEPEPLPFVKTDSCTTKQVGGMEIFPSDITADYQGNAITINSNQGYGLILVVALVIGTVGIVLAIVIWRKRK